MRLWICLALIGLLMAPACLAAEPPEADPAPLPAAFVTATQTLFDDGMADPRGGTYRSITVHVGSVWPGDDGSGVTTHAWVLPRDKDNVAQRAVGWNGLVYDVVADNGPADVKADVEDLLQADSALRATWRKTMRTEVGPRAANADIPPFRRLDDRVPEAASLDAGTLFPIKASLLLRLGETVLAGRVYSAWLQGAPSTDSNYPFLRLANDWSWAALDRALFAHMHGDDRVALADATLLSSAAPKLEDQAGKLGLTAERVRGVPQSWFGFLKPVPTLLDDSRRRVQSPEEPLDLARLKETHKDTTDRISLLIAHLDHIEAKRKPVWANRIYLTQDPISQALIAEGEAAVDPLLEAMDHDTRLTRSVFFGGDYRNGPSLVSVRAAATDCLRTILQTVRSGAALHAYWEENRTVPIAERWYRTLSSESSSRNAWLDAAKRVVQPVRVVGRASDAMEGESLRAAHTKPSVSALLARRVAGIVHDEQLPADRYGNTQSSSFIHPDSVTLGLVLAEWDAKAALPTLRQLMDRVRTAASDQTADSDIDLLGNYAARLTIARLRAGDPSAASDYVAFLNRVDITKFSLYVSDLGKPLYLFPADPTLARAADALFNGPTSQWNPVEVPEDSNMRGMSMRNQIIDSPFICVPAFRKQVLRELDDQRRAGTGVVRGDGSVEVQRHGLADNFGMVSPNDPTAAGTDKNFPIRLCDLYAWNVCALSDRFTLDQTATSEMGLENTTPGCGMPRFALYWPQPDRDRAITALKAYLQRFGDRLSPTPEREPLHSLGSRSVGVRLQFPALHDPATPEDVRAGRAIFSLDAPGARVADLADPLPRAARWKNNTAPGVVAQVSAARSAGNPQPRLDTLGMMQPRGDKRVVLPDTEGIVTQAEEVPVNGKWQRYYGFIGLHTIARVPAEEIVFPDASGQPAPATIR